ATNPPSIASAWTVNRGSGGCGSPFVTSTDGISNVIVWVVGTGGWTGQGRDQRLHGYDGETGAGGYDWGGPNQRMVGTHSRTTGIAAHGRIYVGTNNKVYAFAVPGAIPTPTPTPTPTPSPTPRAAPSPRPRPTPPPRPTPR